MHYVSLIFVFVRVFLPSACNTGFSGPTCALSTNCSAYARSPSLCGGAVSFISSVKSVLEEAGSVSLVLQRQGGSSGATTVTISPVWALSNGTASSFGTSFPQSMSFSNGQTNASLSITLAANATKQPCRSIVFNISAITGSGSIGTNHLCTLLIDDTDPIAQVSSQSTATCSLVSPSSIQAVLVPPATLLLSVTVTAPQLPSPMGSPTVDVMFLIDASTSSFPLISEAALLFPSLLSPFAGFTAGLIRVGIATFVDQGTGLYPYALNQPLSANVSASIAALANITGIVDASPGTQSVLTALAACAVDPSVGWSASQRQVAYCIRCTQLCIEYMSGLSNFLIRMVCLLMYQPWTHTSTASLLGSYVICSSSSCLSMSITLIRFAVVITNAGYWVYGQRSGLTTPWTGSVPIPSSEQDPSYSQVTAALASGGVYPIFLPNASVAAQYTYGARLTFLVCYSHASCHLW